MFQEGLSTSVIRTRMVNQPDIMNYLEDHGLPSLQFFQQVQVDLVVQVIRLNQTSLVLPFLQLLRLAHRDRSCRVYQADLNEFKIISV